jgi:hypothetical protein
VVHWLYPDERQLVPTAFFGTKYALVNLGPLYEEMNAVIRKITYHLVGHCACCDGYRALKYQDREIGYLCLKCADHSAVADIELNFGGYDLCRPGTCLCNL